jgi:DNA (cytosine-5)-methyltransferase 1
LEDGPKGWTHVKVAGLFAGVGGIETGLHAAGHETVLLCEIDPNAQKVLTARFPGIPLVPDIRDLPALPAEVDVVAAGFPCTDLSQAGRTVGISGEQSGLVREVFRLVRRRHPSWLVIENVPNMLVLGGGHAMRYITAELETMGMRWAYRVVDSRFTGVPQRRRRVILVASRQHDPRDVLFGDDAGDRPDEHYRDDTCGFYWTEGLRGLGWALDAVPPLKGGSGLGIPSPPGIWVRKGGAGRKLVMPGVEDAEELQGFPRGWTSACDGARSVGVRLKLVGNAVTTGVAAWIGRRLATPGTAVLEDRPAADASGWPRAAWGERGTRREVPEAGEFPGHLPYRHLTDVVDVTTARPVSHRGATGFLTRARRAKLKFDEQFLADVDEHVRTTAPSDLLEAG